ncbi:hypothetical protein [Persicobacter sp. CCB-QB2]|uniref:hypothetical protein n=1 Tax=Persicobacter sp. CCB-QB2 TaxID=1561025 RepID=UPI0012FB50E2|nr:hypothetical protein [Persicobacter sp. CCB-QB2]
MKILIRLLFICLPSFLMAQSTDNLRKVGGDLKVAYELNMEKARALAECKMRPCLLN